MNLPDIELNGRLLGTGRPRESLLDDLKKPLFTPKNHEELDTSGFGAEDNLYYEEPLDTSGFGAEDNSYSVIDISEEKKTTKDIDSFRMPNDLVKIILQYALSPYQKTLEILIIRDSLLQDEFTRYLSQSTPDEKEEFVSKCPYLTSTNIDNTIYLVKSNDEKDGNDEQKTNDDKKGGSISCYAGFHYSNRILFETEYNGGHSLFPEKLDENGNEIVDEQTRYFLYESILRKAMMALGRGPADEFFSLKYVQGLIKVLNDFFQVNLSLDQMAFIKDQVGFCDALTRINFDHNFSSESFFYNPKVLPLANNIDLWIALLLYLLPVNSILPMYFFDDLNSLCLINECITRVIYLALTRNRLFNIFRNNSLARIYALGFDDLFNRLLRFGGKSDFEFDSLRKRLNVGSRIITRHNVLWSSAIFMLFNVSVMLLSVFVRDFYESMFYLLSFDARYFFPSVIFFDSYSLIYLVAVARFYLKNPIQEITNFHHEMVNAYNRLDPLNIEVLDEKDDNESVYSDNGCVNIPENMLSSPEHLQILFNEVVAGEEEEGDSDNERRCCVIL